MKLYPTPILTISSNKIDDKCSNILDFLKLNNIEAQITPSKSIIVNNNKTSIENSCELVLTKMKVEELKEGTFWNKLKNKFHLNCAHLEIPNVFTGCIMNFLGPSSCDLFYKDKINRTGLALFRK